MKNLTELFTHEQIMAEYKKLCARLGYTPEDLNCFFSSPVFHQWGATDFSRAMIDHYEQLKQEHQEKKLKASIMQELVFYAASFIEKQVRTEGKTMKDSFKSKMIISGKDINKDYLQN